jgi:hypothetical protein
LRSNNLYLSLLSHQLRMAFHLKRMQTSLSRRIFPLPFQMLQEFLSECRLPDYEEQTPGALL